MKRRRWMIVVSVLGVLALGGYAALCGAVYKYQDKLLYFPESYLEVDPSGVGLNFEDFSVEVEPGVTVTGWIVETDPGAPWILQFHGNAGNIANRIPHLQLFHELGFNGVVFDYRGYGKSTGTPSEAGLVADGAAVVKYLEEEKAVDRKWLIYWGESLGGGVAAELAVKEPPRALILKSTYTSVPDLASEVYPFLPVRLLARTYFDTKTRVPNFLFPKLFIHNQADTVIPFEHGQRLFQLAIEPKFFFKAQGDHNTSVMELGDEFKQTVKTFVEQSVPAREE